MPFLTPRRLLRAGLAWRLLAGALAAEDEMPYQACPLLRAYYPPPIIDGSSAIIKSFSANFTDLFDQIISTGGSEDFGEITPETTSFSLVMFSGAESAANDPIFFEYHHTASKAQRGANVTAETRFPLGTLTQLFTVYSWLVEMGDGEWQTPITKFLPGLKKPASASAADLAVNWDDVTVGALAGQMAGIVRDSRMCQLDQPCGLQDFVDRFADVPPIFLPDTTPLISNAAFQLLAFALESMQSGTGSGKDFGSILQEGILDPLKMTGSGQLNTNSVGCLFGQDLNVSSQGEPAALSMFSTTRDLASAGHAILASTLISSGTTRRWLQPTADTSNLRNGVGRPWEIYHAGQEAISPILDVFQKTGAIGHYSAHFGEAPDFNVGFAILAHDTEGNPDLNVYADLVSLALVDLQDLAAEEVKAKYGGVYSYSGGAKDDGASLKTSEDGPGLVVATLKVDGVDLRAEVADKAGIQLGDLDFRLYPTNTKTKTLHQFVAVYQDRGAPADQGTPTCITWQDVGSLRGVANRFVFGLDRSGVATDLRLPDKNVTLSRDS